MSQSVDVAIVVVGLAELMRAVVEAGCEAVKQSELRTEDGRTHEVDLVVRDEQGTEVGVKVDAEVRASPPSWATRGRTSGRPRWPTAWPSATPTRR